MIVGGAEGWRMKTRVGGAGQRKRSSVTQHLAWPCALNRMPVGVNEHACLKLAAPLVDAHCPADASDGDVRQMLMGHKLLPSEGDKTVLAQVRCPAGIKVCFEKAVWLVAGLFLCNPPLAHVCIGPEARLPNHPSHLPSHAQITDKHAQRLLRYLLRRPPSARWDAAKVASCLWFKTSDFQVRRSQGLGRGCWVPADGQCIMLCA